MTEASPEKTPLDTAAAGRVTTVLSIIAILATIAASIPAFLALNAEQPRVFFDQSDSQLLIPDSLNAARILAVLAQEGIPNSTLSLHIVNQGNAKAPEVNVAVTVPGPMVSLDLEPAVGSRQPWVSVEDRGIDRQSGRVDLLLRSLYATKICNLTIGYQAQGKAALPVIEVFSDGAPAQRVDDVRAVPQWSRWDVFRLPAIVFGIGLGVVIIASLVSSLLQKPEVAEQLGAAVTEILKSMLQSILPVRWE
jgi:hypothetical protein